MIYIKQFILPNNNFLYLTFFILSKIILFFFLEIKLSTISYGYHLLDITLLKDDLLKSLLYLHSQPILWNFFNGLVVKIFNGNSEYVTYFFTIYHYFLTWFIFCVSILILKQYHQSKKSELIVFLFIVFNPTIIFYENIFSYAHTTCALFTLLSFTVIKFFETNKKIYEIWIYLILLVLSSLWVLFQPLLILISFVYILFVKKSNNLNILVFILILFISLIPALKNKIIFDTLILSSKSGQDFGTVFYDWERYCGHPIKNKDEFTKKYFEKYDKSFDHPSLIGDYAHFNNIGMIVLGEECFQKTLKRIKKEPKDYIKSRVMAFLASHGKFGFDYVYPNPKGWDKYYKNLRNIYEDKNYKLTRQILVFAFMLIVYITLISLVFSKKYKKMQAGFILIAIFYSYLIIIGNFAGGTEQERIMYTGFVINILFVISILDIFNKKYLT